MNLIIDIGNSFVKLAVFQKNELKVKKTTSPEKAKTELKKIQKSYPELAKAIISSVGHDHEDLISILKDDLKVVNLDSKTKIPFINKYATPKTLGVDRIALVSGAAMTYPKNNVLIIDAGSCITFDFLNTKNKYLGGAISPGLNLRYQSLNNFTANLPLLKIKGPKKLIGNSTAESIHSGVVNGVIFEIEGVIESYKVKYDDLTVILTGGDADFLAKRLKNGIFANSNCLLEGLNHILEFNSN